MLPFYFLFQAVPGKVEAELANGLICGHAYSITSVRMVSISKVLSTSFVAERKNDPNGKNIPVVSSYLQEIRSCPSLWLNINTLKKNRMRKGHRQFVDKFFSFN